MSAATPTPARLGRYRLLGLLGRGAMGEVWLAEAEGEPRVALKALRGTLAGSPDALRRFAREVELVSCLDHPGIVRARSGLEVEGETHFYAMDLVLGRTLEAVLRAGGPLEPAHGVQIACDLLDALAAAHAQGVVHRDVKPANVLVDAEGRCRLTDFGLACAVDRSRVTAAETILGTPAYMSPEQARGAEATARSDLYAVGAVLFELLAGRPPFVAERPVALLRQHLDEPPPDLDALCPGLPAGLAACVGRALEKDPARRFEDARAMIAALEAVTPRDAAAAGAATTVMLKARVAAAPPPPTPAPPEPVLANAAEPPRPRRSSSRAAVAGVGLAIAASVLGFAYRQLRGVEPAAPAAAPSAAPGEPVTVVLLGGGTVDAWLVGYDGATGELEVVERATRRPRTFPRGDVQAIEHEERGDAPR